MLCVTILILTPFAYSKTAKSSEFPLQTTKQKMILTLWNIDVFEGGVWSRTEFLSSVASSFAKDGVLIMVVSHTIESAKEMIKKGSFPDMLSFGVGVDFATEHAKKLPKIDFLGGEINGECYAYPWCVGGYFLIGKNEDYKLIDRLFVSQNTFNLPFGVELDEKLNAKEKIKKAPLDAYTSFLSGGKNDKLLGTQRDIFRLERRGVEFYAKPFENFSDIVQYLSIFASGERYDECLKFARFLTGEKVQSTLDKIGMLSPFFASSQNQNLSKLNFKKVAFTVSPFTSTSIICNIIDDFWQKNIDLAQIVRFKSVLKRLY